MTNSLLFFIWLHEKIIITYKFWWIWFLFVVFVSLYIYLSKTLLVFIIILQIFSSKNLPSPFHLLQTGFSRVFHYTKHHSTQPKFTNLQSGHLVLSFLLLFSQSFIIFHVKIHVKISPFFSFIISYFYTCIVLDPSHDV